MEKIRQLAATVLTILVVMVQTAGFAAWTGKDPGTNFSAPGGAPDNKSPLSGSVSWTEVQPDGDVDKYWTCSAISSDGLTMISGSAWDGGRLYLSSNGGGSWSEVQPAGDVDKIWACVAISGDASTIVAGAEEGRLYRSTDGGDTWNETQPDGDDDWIWESVSVSNNGFTMLASYGGPLFISIDQGVSWNQTGYAGFEQYSKVSVASNGDYLLATAEKEYIFYSNDGGTNWDFVDATGGYNWEWASAAISADGSTMLAATVENSMQGTSGRLFMSIDYGVTWAETQPYGDNVLEWTSVSLSGNGSVMLAGITDGTPFLSTDKGLTWSIMWPAGENNFYEWQTVSVSSVGTTLLAGIYEGRMYKGTITGPPEVEFYGAPVFTSIAVTSSNAIGKIVSTNGANASHRGGIVYEYTDTDKIIGDAGVTQVDSTGTYGTGEFPVSFTGLSANTSYNARVYATNSNGTGYSNREDFYTLANMPGVPTLSSASATSLSLVLNTNNNPAATEFAIQDSVAGTFVQANGTSAVTAVWQTAATWGTVTITGLTTGSTYYFRVKAKNGDGVETAFGSSANRTVITAPTVSYSGNNIWSEAQPAGDINQSWTSVSMSSDGSKMLAAVNGGRLYCYENGSWSETQPAGDVNKVWFAVAMSGDGSKMLAATSTQRIYLYSNGSWAETQPAGNVNKNWRSVAISADGSKMLAAATSGRIYLYSNGAWAETQPAGNVNKLWYTVSLSADGSKMLAGVNNGRLYLFTNGNWIETQPSGDRDNYWKSVSISADGSKMIAAANLGRVYLYNNGAWAETQPAGDIDNFWRAASISSDGNKMLAAASIGKIYTYEDGNWLEAQPAGNNEKEWYSVTSNADGSKMLAAAYGDRLYVGELQKFSNITTTTATVNGKIENTNGVNANEIGAIIYDYTNTDKSIGDAAVTNVSENGDFGLGGFTASLTGLSVNTHYNIRAHATNTAGTGYSNREDFYTLANVPGVPTLSSASATSLSLVLNTNNNPAATEFAIQDSVAGTFVQANGTSAVTAVWQTAATWGTVTITGLTTGSTYYFRVKAKNGDGVETAFGLAASETTVGSPNVEFNGVPVYTEARIPGNNNCKAVSISSDGTALLTANAEGRLYRSVDGGNNWDEVQPFGDDGMPWASVSLSEDGNKMLAAFNTNAGRIFISNDKGDTWNETQPAGNVTKKWQNVAVSDNGNTMLATVVNGRIYRSLNGGTVWAETQPAGNADKGWATASASGDGKYMLAGVRNGNIYLSSDTAATWTSIQATGMGTAKMWTCSAISGDGQLMVAGIMPGRLFLSTNYGVTWAETRPAGNIDKNWAGVSISDDGLTLIAADYGGRLYKSTDLGTTWVEQQPAGNVNKNWAYVAASSDGGKILAGIYNEKLYLTFPQNFYPITNHSAFTTGEVTSLNGFGITHVGAILYDYTDTDKEIGGTGVTQVDSTGTFGIGEFTVSFTGLSPNKRYNSRVYATNSEGTGYSSRDDFLTHANVPGIPILTNLTATTVDVTLDVNANPVETEFAVIISYEPEAQSGLVTKYLHSPTGTLQDTMDWQTSAVWVTTTLTGLVPGIIYVFSAKARNEIEIETAISDTVSVMPKAVPGLTWYNTWEETQPAGATDQYWNAVSASSDGTTILAAANAGYIYKSLDAGASWAEVHLTGDTPQNWMSVSVSANGDVMVAGLGGTPERVFTSTDHGNTWNETQPIASSDFDLIKVCVSDNGSTMLAAGFRARLYKSVNSGSTWSEVQPLGDNDYDWSSLSISSDGRYMLISAGIGYLWLSSDHGNTWNIVMENEVGQTSWSSTSISSDGKFMAAAIGIGRIYSSSDFGVTWHEIKPAGNDDGNWVDVSVSDDGTSILATGNSGRIYYSGDGGNTWVEQQPAGDADQDWICATLSADGQTMLAGIYDGALYAAGGFFNPVTNNSAMSTGMITATNGAGATKTGGIIYEYTNTDKSIGDAGVTQVDSTGTFGTGEFPVSFTGLNANNHYNARVYATNSVGTGYSYRKDFWTLANVPGRPEIDSAEAHSVFMTLDANNNPAITEYTIRAQYEAGTNSFVKYVNATTGALQDDADWQTNTAWGTIEVAGLESGLPYIFTVKARNGAGEETAYSDTASAVPASKPVVCAFGNSFWYETQPAGNSNKNWQTVSVSADGMTMLAGDFIGRLYLSNDKGNTWSEIQPAGDNDLLWVKVSVSGDGSTLLAGVQGGRLYLSTDGGINWSETQPAGNINADWVSLASSTDGSTIMAGISATRLYFSSNRGSSWTEVQPGGDYDYDWRSVAVSGNGNKILAAAKNKRLYLSTDHCTSWNEIQPAGDVDKKWQTVSISTDGNVLIAGVNTGRLYLSTNGGVSWSEQQPAGAVDKKWQAVTVSSDGSKILAGVLLGRLYESNDTGATWSEVQPAGNADKQWTGVAMAANSMISLAGIVFERLYVSDYAGTDNIQVNSARGVGKIQSIEGGDVTNRGFIWYPYTNTNKEMGDADVTNTDESGIFGVGDFTKDLTGLSANNHYNTRAHATNYRGTSYSDRKDFWTLANVPDAPTVINPMPTSLDVVVNGGENPVVTKFALQDSSSGSYVQINGTLGASAAWQTATGWDTITVTGLTACEYYHFRVKAVNGAGVESVFGSATGAYTCVSPVSGGTIGSAQTICSGTTPEALTNTGSPQGYCGTLEYKWQYSTVSSSAGFIDIDSTNQEGYEPGNLNITTWFKRLSRIDCRPGWTLAGESNVVKITVDAVVTPMVTIAQTSGNSPCCPAESVTFTATPTNGGLNPAYEWFLNGSSVGSTATYTVNPVDGDDVHAVMTTSLQCYTKEKDTSNTVTMQVTVPAVVSVSIRATRAPGGQVKFTAYPVNGGDNPVYIWYKNGVEIDGATGPELISTCRTGDEHRVELISSLPCNTTPVSSGAMCTY